MLVLLLAAMVGLVLLVGWMMLETFALAVLVTIALVVGGAVLGASMTG